MYICPNPAQRSVMKTVSNYGTNYPQEKNTLLLSENDNLTISRSQLVLPVTPGLKFVTNFSVALKTSS